MSDPTGIPKALLATLRPVRPLTNRLPIFWAVAVLGVASAFVASTFGLRAELSGQATMTLVSIVKPLWFMVIGSAAITAAAPLIRPEGEVGRTGAWGLMLGLAALAGAFGLEVLSRGWAEALRPLQEPMRLCVVTVLSGGVLAYGAMWLFVLRRSAPTRPVLLGALLGGGIGALVAAAYALHCDRDFPVYAIAYYAGPAVLIAILAALVTPRLTRW